MTSIKQLIHNGIKINEYDYKELSIEIDGVTHKLTPRQEEMAIAWVRKLSTVYVEDPIFCRNFFEDFNAELGTNNLTDDNIDFSEVIEYIEKERAKKDALTKEEKKAAREERKVVREKLAAHYGTAILDGSPVEVSNWTAEPSSIFMGRGEHPMRGKWKEGPKTEDIILNLSDDAPRPEGNWKEIVFESECLWVAKWTDKLSGKTKYVWLSDNTPIKQQREIEKYNKANLVGNNLEEIRAKVIDGIKSNDERTRKVATACYIIDTINMRVGDEKDEDEADTVGATTLRPEHITIEGNVVKFNFLGKDSVEWKKEAEYPDEVITVIHELIAEAEEHEDDKSQLFSNVGSRHVNAFLGEIVEGLTAKVFRTFYATKTVSDSLDESDVGENDPEFMKKEAAVMANREAAIICNHMKQIPKNFDNRLQRFRERKVKGKERIAKAEANQKVREAKLEEYKQDLKPRRKQLKEQEKKLEQVKIDYTDLRDSPVPEKKTEADRLKKAVASAKKKVDSQRKRVETAKKRIETAKGRIDRAKNSVGTAKERVYKAKLAYKKIESQERISKNTKQWNLGTSLKSYIDPRVYYEWGKNVDYDWKNYYSKTLEKKFSWVEREDEY